MNVLFDEWAKDVPAEIRRDSLWNVQAYQLALYLFDLCHQDSEYCRKDDQARVLWDQLYRATGSISANIAEGYSKSTGKDRARFYEYALGSARESRDWYYKVRHALPAATYQARLDLLTHIIRLLITMIPQQRTGGSIREDEALYNAPED
jgi:four helix bundle protein